MEIYSQGCAQLERSLNTFWNYYEMGEFDASIELVRRLGYSDATIDYVFDPESYYIPNVRGDHLVRPRGTDTDAIPIVPMYPGMIIELPERLRFHTLQIEQMLRQGVAPASIERMSAVMAAHVPRVTRAAGRMVTASISSPIIASGEPDGGHYHAKPVMVCNFEMDKPQEVLCPTAILHEKVHIVQNLDRPRYHDEDRLDAELEAYAAQDEIEPLRTIELSDNTAMALTVNSFRKRHLGREVFRATPEFRELILGHELLSGIVQ